MNEAESPGARQGQAQRLPHAVFISYARDDQNIADAICAGLESDGIRCWMAPRDVQAGRPYSGQITQAIREARVLLLVLSQASNRSKHVLREVERAAHCQNYLLTFRIGPIAPGDDLAYFLGADHWVDGFRPLPPAQHFPTLIEHTRALLQSDAVESDSEVESDADASEAFAHFRILRRSDGSLFRLGKGGMGVTYKAIDTVLNRPVALKVIAAELLRSPASRQRFLREAQAAALIQHPHVANIFQFGEEGDAYFYAMEFVDGEDLERYVSQHGPLGPATALRVVLQVAQALEAAKARQLIHRDIKPANIMAVANRAGNLDVKLIDFGLAKGAGAEALETTRITRTQDFVGSPAFASPEQCEMEKLDTRSDIYSLGVTLWYLLSGKRPFSGTVGQVLIAQVVKPPPFEQLAQVPQPVITLLERMLRKNRDERFQTPEELQTAVEATAAKLASVFGAVPERLAAKVGTTPLSDKAEPAMEHQAEPVVLTTPAAPLFDSYLAVEVGTLAANRYRLVSEEREGNGGRLFHAKDEKATVGQPTEFGLKLLHPGFAADPALIGLLENEIGVIRQATHPHLVRYWRLEPGAPGPWLVREWVHGFLLYDLLRWRRSLRPVELMALLGPLASTLDFVSSQGLGLVDVSVRKILVACPPEIVPEDFSSLARGDARDWNRLHLLLNPLSLAPLLFRSRNGWDRQTIVPTSRVLSMTQAEGRIRGSKAVRLHGRLVYELLSGRAPVRSGDPLKYAPLPELDQAGNETLRRACVAADPAYPNCETFWNALKENIAAAGRPTSVPLSRPVTPTPPLPPPSPLAPPPKRRLMIGAIVGGALIIAFAIFVATRFSGSGSTTSPTPTPTVAEPTATPTPAPQTNEQLAKTYFDRALEELNKGEHQAAIADFTEAIRLKPGFPEAYNNRGNGYSALKQYEKAVSDFTEAIRLKPDLAEPYFNRGNGYSALKQYETAIGDYTEAIRLKPDFVSAFNNRGNRYHALKQYEKAIGDYTEAIRLKPDLAEAFNGRGNAYSDLKQYEVAISNYTEAIRLKPDLAEAFNGRGVAYDQLKQYDKALSDLTEAIRLKPDFALPYNNRGYAYNALKQYDKALSDLTEAIRLKPDYPEAYNNRGNGYSALRQYEKAVSDYTEAIRLKPDYAKALYNRSNAYDALGDKSKAEQDRKKAEELSGNH